MKIRKEAVILGIVIVALSLYLIFNKDDRSLYDLPQLEAVSASEISKITLTSVENDILFTQKAGKWVINEAAWPGDEANIKKVADIAANLNLTTLISESKNFERYDLDPDHKITLKAWKGDTLVREFDVGKGASGHRHTFVKLADDHRVYHAKDNFRSRVQGDADRFRNKTVLSFETDTIEQVQITKVDEKGSHQGTFTKEAASQKDEKASDNDAAAETLADVKPIWKNADGEVVKESELTKLIDDMSGLKCKSYVYDRKKEDFKDTIASITFRGPQEYTLKIYDREKGASEYPAVSSQNDDAFFIPKWQADQVIKALTDIVPAEAEKEDAT